MKITRRLFNVGRQSRTERELNAAKKFCRILRQSRKHISLICQKKSFWKEQLK